MNAPARLHRYSATSRVTECARTAAVVTMYRLIAHRAAKPEVAASSTHAHMYLPLDRKDEPNRCRFA